MKMTRYQEKANQIIRDSIKSAIFIDENARSFFSLPIIVETPSLEERLSVALYENFKKQGISLAIHNFSNGDEENEVLKQYLFENRDLVLLDWKLDDQTGEEAALKMLSDIVNSSHLHFCAIYTSTPNLDEIYLNILNYFSEQDDSFYNSLKAEFEANEEELIPILEQFNIYDLNANGHLIGQFIRSFDVETLNYLKTFTKTPDPLRCLKYLKIAFSKLHKSSHKLPSPELISISNKTLVINNTIITILDKNEDEDSTELINRLSKQIANSKNSFIQLLGFEMQSIFRKNSSFIDTNLLNVSKEALIVHRQDILRRENSDIPFKSLIKNVLIEHASMSLRTAELSLLEGDFLDNQNQGITPPVSDEALCSMNVFYNSTSSVSTNGKLILNFGDVFIDGTNSYYLCLTALCDCLRPDKIKNNFFFAKGNPIDRDLALKLGDSGFISFLPNNKIISWVAPEIDENRVVPATMEQYQIELDYYKQYKHKPIYIKPIQYHVTNNKIIENKIEISRIETDNNEADFDFKELNYIATIRSNYTQRMANHAFTHPVRVGIDFVKKKT